MFADDPLRLLRLARLAHELGFTVDPEAERLARRDAHLAVRPSGERVLIEIRRLLEPEHPDDGIRLLDRLGVLDVVLPEAAAMRGVGQSPFHHLDVFEHTLAVLDTVADISAHPAHYLGDAAPLVSAALAAEVGNDFDGHTGLRLAALFHDIDKPSTRVVSGDGRVSFMGHDRKGRRHGRAGADAVEGVPGADRVLPRARLRAPAAGLPGAGAAVRPPHRLPLRDRHGAVYARERGALTGRPPRHPRRAGPAGLHARRTPRRRSSSSAS